MSELERRGREAEAARKRTERRNAAREAKERAKEAEFDRQLADGVDPEEAYARAYGVSVERQRRQSAILSLRDAGYKGAGFDQLVQSAFRDHASQAYLDAETVTRGHMLNKAGQAARVHPSSLFTGPEARARKYASEELLSYWQTHGRPTVDDFKAGLLGGEMRSAGTAAFL